MTKPAPEPFYLSEEDGEVYEETTPGNCIYWNPQQVVEELNRLRAAVAAEREALVAWGDELRDRIRDIHLNTTAEMLNHNDVAGEDIASAEKECRLRQRLSAAPEVTMENNGECKVCGGSGGGPGPMECVSCEGTGFAPERVMMPEVEYYVAGYDRGVWIKFNSGADSGTEFEMNESEIVRELTDLRAAVAAERVRCLHDIALCPCEICAAIRARGHDAG